MTSDLLKAVNLFQVLREVKVLAHLGHANVVGYHGAWLEYVASECSAPPLHSKDSVIVTCTNTTERVATRKLTS